jgi:hypothetical protein
MFMGWPAFIQKAHGSAVGLEAIAEGPANNKGDGQKRNVLTVASSFSVFRRRRTPRRPGHTLTYLYASINSVQHCSKYCPAWQIFPTPFRDTWGKSAAA